MTQAHEALAKANAVRSAKSADKALIRRSEQDPLRILSSPPEHWKKAEVMELLLAMPRVGPRRAGSWLRMANIPPNVTLGGLTEAQRFKLFGFVEYAKQRPPLKDQRGP
jgi:hypothetical protein